MRTKLNIRRCGGLAEIDESAREKLLGVACFECDEEIYYSQVVFHRGHPQIRCRNCGRRGYMIREAREGGRLIWFRPNADVDAPAPPKTL